jgi:hypothetical protein
MMAAMIDVFCASFDEVPRRILLDIDDTVERVHGGQQLALFNAHHDSRCFLPIHLYEATTGKPVAMILRPGKTPDGTEVAFVHRAPAGRAIRLRSSGGQETAEGEDLLGPLADDPARPVARVAGGAAVDGAAAARGVLRHVRRRVQRPQGGDEGKRRPRPIGAAALKARPAS